MRLCGVCVCVPGVLGSFAVFISYPFQYCRIFFLFCFVYSGCTFSVVEPPMTCEDKRLTDFDGLMHSRARLMHGSSNSNSHSGGQTLVKTER